ncbi:bifunctional [glutamate--ammonia ligase]-adenylyl-L-tyrosine phosphorylase/[glutamate--ammonia-ligase] adenylyltransferase [Rheinheimera sp. UJ51]|uniref:bifunctional [glutamate--ammonia ligase]-adenylyl-L-tyrosine phosphorylase/[glutamate--ammonia-ligase] adenylyltransferase n=1 Tax=Rheinheimera sp. UJ51 TaxID=2892446 RepID=UPI001E561B47|nr:bifunctional [glutamate--ammonia ligase]-adenylyl-L-tyrosine phosphorylase/[glutamate--ammonia-ligase] adenylyltransferase [Rheinheimera sp. UJ51]MCC5452691.1 bifunctional [glutamate--ammonia ligase]-adenylyl-L-tyrosine phosphorylase/[glutamate--ammonia-ligase] adenylyltransferase [Rheinheimera sp. UJ51]
MTASQAQGSYWQADFEALSPQLDAATLAKLTRLLQSSTFIGRTLRQQPQLLALCCDNERLQQHLAAGFYDPLTAITSTAESDVFSALRRYRNASLCLIMAADIFELQPIAASLTSVSQLANTLINSAYQWAYQQQSLSSGQPLDEQGEPMPLLILGMGKLGGGELNFSSDIDLIFTYPSNGETVGGRRPLEHQQFFTKVGQKLIAALHQVTADGFCYRVDMRLRPFGDSGPLVLSFAALEDYYQEQGREWERYAMLKARVLNPDKRYAPELQALLKPFIYRRYIDFSAIESLRRMKQLIEQENRRRNRRDNIKLGAGGIREVEFIVQTLQLIRGGRIPQLQQQSLLKVLPLLQEHELLSAEHAAVLQQDYLWLRQVEQGLQGIDDKQTQTLPAEAMGQQQLLACLGRTDWASLQADIEAAMQRIHQYFKLVIEPEENLESQELSLGRLLWDSDSVGPDLAEQVDWLDMAEATALLEQLQQFKLDCQRRSVGPRGREYLAKLMPQLLHWLQHQQASNTILSRILGVFSKIVTRTAYLELLFENPPAMQQLVLLCSQSGWLAEQLARYPMLLDELIDPSQLYQVATIDDYRDRLRLYLLRVPEDDLELLMETLRQFKQAQQLRIAAADISGALPLMKVSDHLTWLAEVIVEQLVNLAWQQMVARYGLPAGASDQDKGFAVIGYGKLGGLELGYGSDLDLVFLHQCRSQEGTSGDRSIDSLQFYLKLVQRILHLSTTRTNSGVLYEIDTRLRPSGNSGLLAIHIDTYQQYLQQDAWTWEHQALVRARMILGSADLRSQFSQIRQHILTLARDPAQLTQDVLQMRAKLREHHGVATNDVKHSVGGIVDLEFLSQYLVLAYSKDYPALFEFTDNIRILAAAAASGLLPEAEATALAEAYQVLRGAGHRHTLAPATVNVDSGLAQHRAQVQQSWQHWFANAPTA